MNMKNCGHRNILKHRDIKGSDKYVTLDISLKFDSLDNRIITSSGSEVKLGISVKGLIISLGIKSKTSPKKYKRAWYSVRNVSKKDLSKIIRDFEKLTYGSYDENRPKHEPFNSYFYLARQFEKCMM